MLIKVSHSLTHTDSSLTDCLAHRPIDTLITHSHKISLSSPIFLIIHPFIYSSSSPFCTTFRPLIG